jgi:two-component system chemotaxis response regulator CheB
VPDARRIRTLIAEDSPTARELLLAIFASDPVFDLVAVASNGQEAVELTHHHRPDVVTMDIHLPILDGFEATKRIMEEVPTPVVIVSAVDVRDVAISMSALRVGALAVHPKPYGPMTPGFEESARLLVATVRAMSQVKVVRRWSAAEPARLLRNALEAPRRPRSAPAARVIAVVASTGGPAALEQILHNLPRDLGVPILVVQHMAPGFIVGAAAWLTAACARPVAIAREGELPRPDTVYLAPDGHHLGIYPDGRLHLSTEPPVDGFRPSGTHLFRSVARAYGSGAVGVILTGMGEDGVDGLRMLRDLGGYVIAQDEATSVVFGMPGATVAAGLADRVLPLMLIGAAMVEATTPGAKS